MIVYQNGRPVRIVKAIVGKPSTPTPHGEFFVEESIELRAGDVGAPFALALSARSNVFQEFDGGPGQIALHGLTNVGGVLGTAVSHGCVRLDNGVMRWLVVRIGPGVPVTITLSADRTAPTVSCPLHTRVADILRGRTGCSEDRRPATVFEALEKIVDRMSARSSSPTAARSSES